MPPKNKNLKADWNECLLCHRILNTRDLVKHASVCKDDAPLSISLGTALDHGFIDGNNVLYAVVCEANDKVEDISIPSSNKKNLVFLNVMAMKICRISIGRPVVCNNESVYTAWASNTLPAAGVGLSSDIMERLKVKKGDVISVSSFLQPVFPASHVTVVPREWKSFMNSGFTDYLIKNLDDKHIALGNLLILHYYGQDCSLQVTKIVDHKGESSELNSPDTQLDITRDGTTDACIQEESVNEITSGLGSINLDSSVMDETASSIVNSSISGDFSGNSPICRNVSDSLNHEGQSFCSTPKRSTNDELTNFRPLLTPINSKPQGFTVSTKLPPSVYQQKQFYRISNSVTKLDLKSNGQQTDRDVKSSHLTFDSIGGLKEQIKVLKQMVELPLKQPQLFQSYGLQTPSGVLLFGPPGTGKTLVAMAMANEMNVTFISISGPEIWSKFYGETEAKLRNIFKSAVERSPSVVFIDELDALCPKRENAKSEMEKRVVGTLLTLMDGIDMGSKGKVILLAATNKIDSLDPALRRPGRFDKEVEFSIPTAADRRDILNKLLTNVEHTLSADDVKTVADSSHGYTGADLSALCREAGLSALKRTLNSDLNTVAVSLLDVQSSLQIVKPSAMRQVAIDVPKVYWSDIGGQADLKQKLKQAVEWPLRHPEAFTRLGIQPPRGLLMYGPPGCSKTLIAKALATESGLNFIAIKGPELFSKWVGESERAVREVFRKARAAAPSIVFFDEIDALAVARGSESGSSNVADRVLTQLLTEMDGVEKLQDVTVVAATNRPDMIDQALMRPGRIDRVVYVPLPDENTRREIFKIKFKNMPIGSSVDIDYLVKKTEKYSGAEVAAVCHEAAMNVMQRNMNAEFIEAEDFSHALGVVTPRISDNMIDFYENYYKKSGLHSV